MIPGNPIFCALDTTDVTRAVALARGLKGSVGGAKIGMEFFNAHGPAGYRAVAEAGLPIFLDLKLHDIPNTVAGGVRAVLPLEPAIVNIHTAGGSAMMRAAAEAAREAGDRRPLIIGVTLLTSLDETDLAATGVGGTASDQVRRLAPPPMPGSTASSARRMKSKSCGAIWARLQTDRAGHRPAGAPSATRSA